ncbi:MAG: molybdate ABC transporter substrate-binding protein [Cyanobacteria bacterium P01_F01_bin.3]
MTTYEPLRRLPLLRRKAKTLMAIACTALTVGCQSVASTLTPKSEEKPRGSKRPPVAQSTQKISLTISAAASLQNALREIEPLFEQRYPNIDIFYNWGGSGALQRQIERGAPADIFFSASPIQMAALAEQGRLSSGSPKVVLANRLVLIVPVGSRLTDLASLSELKASERIAVGEFRSVPAGQYARDTLAHFQLLPDLSSQLIFFSNVRGVLTAVESGHAAAGLVYLTDAELSAQVRIVAIAPETSHAPIDYPIAILQRSENPQAAQKYLDFLSDPVAIETFNRYGFNPR